MGLTEEVSEGIDVGQARLNGLEVEEAEGGRDSSEAANHITKKPPAAFSETDIVEGRRQNQLRSRNEWRSSTHPYESKPPNIISIISHTEKREYSQYY